MKKIGHEEAVKLAEALRNSFSSRVSDAMPVSLGDVKNVTDYMGHNDMGTTNLLLKIIFALLDRRKADCSNNAHASTSASPGSVNNPPYHSQNTSCSEDIYIVKDIEVTHPSHYNQHERECIVEMYTLFGLKKFITFCHMNAWKYRYRAGSKANNTADKDNAKADRYIEYAARARDMDYWNIPPHRLTDDEYWKSDTVRGTY